jgi:hypothetical protein
VKREPAIVNGSRLLKLISDPAPPEIIADYRLPIAGSLLSSRKTYCRCTDACRFSYFPFLQLAYMPSNILYGFGTMHRQLIGKQVCPWATDDWALCPMAELQKRTSF